MKFEEALKAVRPVDKGAAERSRKHWNSLGKPLYGLGDLEELIIRIAAIQQTEVIDISRRALVVFCADNGVVEEGVSQSGPDVTALVSENILHGKSSVAIMCRRAQVDVFPLDVGIYIDTPNLEKCKCCYGTRNMTREPAMTKEEAVFVIEAGINKACELAQKGYKIFTCGEMGIGNTTTSAAIAAVFLGLSPELVTGRGAGLSNAGLVRKTDAIRRAIAVNQPDPDDAMDVLCKVGGFDIAGLVGLMIGAAVNHIPVVIDGLITAAAALTAVRLRPELAQYLIPSHLSEEPATMSLMEAVGLKPVIRANMHLGEGTGAVAMLPLLDLAADVYKQMETFEGISLEVYKDYAAGEGDEADENR